MREALIGLVGLLIGVLLTEYYRRRSRIENYSARVFDRRLDAYEGLLKRIQASATTVRDLVEDASLTAEQKHKIAYEVGLEVMEYCDQHELFLDEEITVHVGAAFVGVADILEAEQQQDKEAALNRFNRDVRNARSMILADSGVSEMNSLFRSITKAKHDSPVIDYLRQKRKQQLGEDRADA